MLSAHRTHVLMYFYSHQRVSPHHQYCHCYHCMRRILRWTCPHQMLMTMICHNLPSFSVPFAAAFGCFLLNILLLSVFQYLILNQFFQGHNYLLRKDCSLYCLWLLCWMLRAILQQDMIHLVSSLRMKIGEEHGLGRVLKLLMRRMSFLHLQ